MIYLAKRTKANPSYDTVYAFDCDKRKVFVTRKAVSAKAWPVWQRSASCGGSFEKRLQDLRMKYGFREVTQLPKGLKAL